MLDIVPFATYVFVMSITPGPNNVMLTANAANFGLRRAWPHMFGICFGFVVQLTLVCAGLGAAFAEAPRLQAALAWVGAAYLAYMAWRILMAGAAEQLSSGQPVRFIEAALFQWVNPKAWVISVTVAALFVPTGQHLLLTVLLMAPVIAMVNLPSLLLWAVFGDGLRRVLRSPVQRWCFNGTMAVALLGSGMWMLWSPT